MAASPIAALDRSSESRNFGLDRAERHAQKVERLLEGQLAIITNYVQAQVDATLTVYYATRQRTST